MFTTVARCRFEDHSFEGRFADDPLVVHLRIPDGSAYDSLHRGTCDDVSAYVIFYFGRERGMVRGVVNLQFVADSDQSDGVEVVRGACSICRSTENSYFECGMWPQHSEMKKLSHICENCVELFLEIRDELLSKYSGEIISEEL